MDVFWEVPLVGFVKINVHCVVVENPMPNGNRNGVGVIIRDPTGERLWAALGSLSHLTDEQAIVTALHAACEHAISKGWDATHIETTSPRVYDTISLQEHIFLDQDQLEVYRKLNTLLANNFKEGLTKRKVACIPGFMNGSAEYLANYGLANVTEFGEINHSVGELDHFLARDMGRTLIPASQLLDNGEVVDGPPPSKKQKLALVLPMYRSDTLQADKGIEEAVNNTVSVSRAKDSFLHALAGTMNNLTHKLFATLDGIKGLMSFDQGSSSSSAAKSGQV